MIEDKEYVSRCRFVDATETVNKELSGGHWITIKKRLAVGEQKKVDAGGMRRVSVPGEKPVMELDYGEYSFVRAETYLVDWSFKNKESKDVALTPSAIRALDEETFDEIENALTTHIEEMTEAKKIRAGSKQ